MLEAKYHFYDEFYLTARVNDKGKQQLVITLEPDGTVLDSYSIDCIHTAITEIPLSNLESVLTSESEQVRLINSRTSEDLRVVNLSLEEKFKAFNSWTSGIAEAGLDAFKIQSEIESMAGFVTPISGKLLSFMIIHDGELLGYYLTKIDRECRHEGVYHFASLAANLKTVKGYLSSIHEPERSRAIDLVISFEFPFRAMKELASIPAITNYLFNNYPKEVKSLFTDKDYLVRKVVALNPEATRFEEYKQLFTDKDNGVRRTVASNPEATKLEEYKQLFTDKDNVVRELVALNPEATKLEEYEQLFTDKDNVVRELVALNPEATRFTEYKQLFKDKYDLVREAVAHNPEAIKLKIHYNLAQHPNK